MIGLIQGRIVEAQAGVITLAVGSDEHFVGYSISVPQTSDYHALWTQTAPVRFYVYSHIREDAIEFYGFLDSSQKEIFTSLISVAGVGPKAGLAMLSACVQPGDLVRAIVDGDKKFLVGLPGVGAKKADRLLIELKDQLQKKLEAGLIAITRDQVGSSMRPSSAELLSAQDHHEVQDALMALGYREAEIRRAIAKVSDVQVAKESVRLSVADWIKHSLRELGSHSGVRP